MKEITIDIEDLTEVEEYKCILVLYNEATEFLLSHDWCKKIINAWHDKEFSIYEKFGVFLFEIEPDDNVKDAFVWVIVGDIPTVHIDQSVTTSKEAVRVYCNWMNDWSNHIFQGIPLNECYPVRAEPTEENAQLLNNKISFIRKELLLEST